MLSLGQLQFFILMKLKIRIFWQIIYVCTDSTNIYHRSFFPQRTQRRVKFYAGNFYTIRSMHAIAYKNFQRKILLNAGIQPITSFT